MKLPEPICIVTAKLGEHCSFKSNALSKGDSIYSEAQLREALAQQEIVMRMALEALNKAASTCFTRIDHHEFMSRPDHFCNQAIKALEDALK